MQPGKNSAEPRKEVGRWAPDEHQRFMAAIATYGKDWKKVEELVGTRSGSQVRSHAQKFFNKLHKQESSRRSQHGESKGHEHDAQAEGEQSEIFFDKYAHDDASNTTPVEIVTLIRGEAQKDQKVNIKNLKKKLEEHLAVIHEENNQQQLLDNLKRQKSYKSMNNILDAYETVKESGTHNDTESESFLMGLAKHYKKYFAKGGCFENLIDFGNPHEVQNASKALRKRSFTLPEGVEGDQQDLEERKKRVITEQSTSKVSQSQRNVFKEAAQSRRQKALKEEKTQRLASVEPKQLIREKDIIEDGVSGEQAQNKQKQ